MRTRSLCLELLVLLTLIMAGASAYPVSETVGGFNISFEANGETNAVAKSWGGPQSMSDSPFELPEMDIDRFYLVMAGNAGEESFAGCFVIVLNQSVRANAESLEDLLLTDSTSRYVRVFDRPIDGHDAVLMRFGDEPDDQFMEYIAMYWLNADDGLADKGVIVYSKWPWEKGTEKMIDSVHVEEINQTEITN